MRRWVWLLAAGLILAGCVSPGAAQPAPDGASVHTLTFGGLERSYRLYRPAGLPAAAPLVVMLHGGFGSANNAERRYGWDELADSAKFVVAYPDGASRSWNTGGNCCGRAAAEGIDDAGFIAAVVGDVGSAMAIDPARVYATGMSNGGIMAYTLACTTELFAAIGPVAATQLGPCRSPHPTSVLHIHGTADPNIPYDGGPGAGVARIDGPSVPDVDAFWRNVDGCTPPVTTTDGAVTTSVAACPSGRSVQLTTVAGGGHQWPDAATAMLWQFFAEHPR